MHQLAAEQQHARRGDHADDKQGNHRLGEDRGGRFTPPLPKIFTGPDGPARGEHDAHTEKQGEHRHDKIQGRQRQRPDIAAHEEAVHDSRRRLEQHGQRPRDAVTQKGPHQRPVQHEIQSVHTLPYKKRVAAVMR